MCPGCTIEISARMILSSGMEHCSCNEDTELGASFLMNESLLDKRPESAGILYMMLKYLDIVNLFVFGLCYLSRKRSNNC